MNIIPQPNYSIRNVRRRRRNDFIEILIVIFAVLFSVACIVIATLSK
jgi:type IV secretory pathway component VirB8